MGRKCLPDSKTRFVVVLIVVCALPSENKTDGMVSVTWSLFFALFMMLQHCICRLVVASVLS